MVVAVVVVVMACPVDCRPAAAVVAVADDRSVASFQATMMCQSADDDDHSRQFLVDPFPPCFYSSVFVCSVPSFDSVPAQAMLPKWKGVELLLPMEWMVWSGWYGVDGMVWYGMVEAREF
jgi:hypothetical protein